MTDRSSNGAVTLAAIKTRLGLPATASGNELLAAFDRADRRALHGRLAAKVGLPSSATGAEVLAATDKAIAAADKARRSHTQQSAAGAGDFAVNPLVANLPGPVYAAASTNGPPPSLFEGGNLPTWTASGVNPTRLLEAPWVARHALATNPNRDDVEYMLTEFASPGGVELAQEVAGSTGNMRYRQRVTDWVHGALDALGEESVSSTVSASSGAVATSQAAEVREFVLGRESEVGPGDRQWSLWPTIGGDGRERQEVA